MLNYRLSCRRATGHGTHIDTLSAGDLLVTAAARSVCANFERTGEVNVPALDYILHKRALLKAYYFRQRYGRSYFAERND